MRKALNSSLCLVALCWLWLAVSSCSTTPTGLAREGVWYERGTNAVQTIERVILPVVPAPWNGVVEGGLALATASLAAWNAWQQKHMNGMKKAIEMRPKAS